MFATRRIQARRHEHQSLYRFAAHNVRVDDFVNVRLGHASIPNGLRVDNYSRPVLALIKAPRLIGPDSPLEAALRQFFFD